MAAQRSEFPAVDTIEGSGEAGALPDAVEERSSAGSICSRMSAALVHSTCADNCFALDAAFVRSTSFLCSRLRISRQDRSILR